MADGSRVTSANLELSTPSNRHANKSLKEARETLERELVQRALESTKGNLTQAAANLGISRPTLYELIEKLGINKRG